MASETKVIMDRLDEIKSELDYIRKHMVDVDAVLTEEDIEALKEAEEDYILGNSLQSSEHNEPSRKYVKGKKCVYRMMRSRNNKIWSSGARKLYLYPNSLL